MTQPVDHLHVRIELALTHYRESHGYFLATTFGDNEKPGWTSQGPRSTDEAAHKAVIHQAANIANLALRRDPQTVVYEIVALEDIDGDELIEAPPELVARFRETLDTYTRDPSTNPQGRNVYA